MSDDEDSVSDYSESISEVNELEANYETEDSDEEEVAEELDEELDEEIYSDEISDAEEYEEEEMARKSRHRKIKDMLKQKKKELDMAETSKFKMNIHAPESNISKVVIISDNERITSDILQLDELTEAIGIRATQIENNAPVCVPTEEYEGLTSPIDIATREFMLKKNPLIVERIVRTVGNIQYIERWKVRNMGWPANWYGALEFPRIINSDLSFKK